MKHFQAIEFAEDLAKFSQHFPLQSDSFTSWNILKHPLLFWSERTRMLQKFESTSARKWLPLWKGFQKVWNCAVQWKQNENVRNQLFKDAMGDFMFHVHFKVKFQRMQTCPKHTRHIMCDRLWFQNYRSQAILWQTSAEWLVTSEREQWKDIFSSEAGEWETKNMSRSLKRRLHNSMQKDHEDEGREDEKRICKKMTTQDILWLRRVYLRPRRIKDFLLPSLKRMDVLEKLMFFLWDQICSWINSEKDADNAFNCHCLNCFFCYFYWTIAVF